MSDDPKTIQRDHRPLGGDPAETSRRGRHPQEEGEQTAPPSVPEDEDIVPDRHSASAEAALLRWRETHDDT